ncbi:Thioredoxin-like 1-1 [Morus notabilis]|uniref:Thioredoxin-like 1-1 n=1 Tax=Morus notabilis TaxID=981085 RepID=W9QQL6_9ROSA|nr:thioredoxin-like 1-1, chloroplastic [Morus notabilis]EXB36260.1 Thioredoxin-like 1-1 [Morus notabilis]
MADVLSKTSLFSSINQSISVFPKSCNFIKSGPCCSLKLKSNPSTTSFSSNSDFHGKRIVLQREPRRTSPSQASTINAQTALRIGKAHKWWGKGLQPNMKEVTSAQDLVDSLLKAGDKLVVVDFFSPGCGGCKALHPKICQFAEMNPDVQFIQVNYEEHKSMCYSLNVHVLPFFRFYRGAHGRLCSFSCTNATIKKFKDALAKHSPDRCGLALPKGLEEKELIALAANKDLSFTYTPKPVEPVPAPALAPAEQVVAAEAEPSSSNKELVVPRGLSFARDSEDKTLVAAGR